MKKFTIVLAIFIAIGINAIGQAGWNMVGSGLPADKGVGQISIGMNDNTAMWGMAINSDGTIYDAFTRSTDGGNTWEAGTFNAGTGLSMIFAFDADVCWAVFNTGATQGLYKTTDGGLNWVKKGGVYGASSFANVIHFFNDLDGFAQGDPVGGDYELYTTTDGGETWVAVDPDDIPAPTSGEYGITGDYCAFEDNIWFGTNQGRVYRSTDMGYTWDVSLTAFGNTNVVAPLFFDADNGIAYRSYLDMGIEPELNGTSDGGATWTVITTSGPSFARWFYHVPGTVNTLIGSAADAAAGEGISYSEDGGYNWTEITSGYPFMASAWFDMETGWCGTLSSGDGTDGMYIYSNTPPPPGPENVTAMVEGLNDVHVDWDEPSAGAITAFSDDFESYEDFVLEFSPWTNVDVDGSTTYGFSGIDWPNAYDPQAYIIFNPSMTTPAVEDITPHSGDKLAACFAATAPPNDDWLISPQLLIESGDQLSFWVKSYTDQYGLERYKVGISTTGTDPADFTIVSGTGYLEAPVADWEEYTYDLASYVGDEIYVGIQCVSNDAFIFLVDDFSVGSTKSNITYNSNTAVTGNAVKDININAVPGKPNTVYGGPNATKSVLEGYNVLRDGEEIAYVETPTTEYDDMDLDPGTYEYCVIAIYDDGESFEECADPVTINPQSPPPAPTNLETAVDGEDIVLTWDAPGEEWIQWDSGENNGNGIGLTGGGTMVVSSHWDPASLEDYFGLSLTQIQFFPNADPDATFTIKVWTGPTGMNEVLSQEVTSFTVDEWNLVELDTPVVIDGTQDLWFGYEVVHGADQFPAGCDDGPAIVGYGDMIISGGAWVDLVSLAATLDFNWNLAGYVEAMDGTTQQLGKPMNPSSASGDFVASGPTGVTSKMNTAGSKAFDEYYVYYSYDGGAFEFVAGTTETTFTHSGAGTIAGEHCYEVTAYYDPEGESEPTPESCELITAVPEFLVNATSIYPNPASDIVNIKSDFEIEFIRVYNHAGQIVTDQMINNTIYQVNTSEFNPGLYLFQINTTEGTITERIIVQ